MRSTSSRHNETLRALPAKYFSHFGIRLVPKQLPNELYRPSLNIPVLVDLIQVPISNAFHALIPEGKGKKRATSHDSPVNGKTQKRAKTSQSAANGTIRRGNEQGDKIFVWAPMHYPELEADCSPAPAKSIPVFTHTFEIDYNNSIPSGSMPGYFATEDSGLNWTRDEQNLEDSLGLLGGPFDEPHEFDLGAVGFAIHAGRIVVVSDVLRKRNNTVEWLLLLPKLQDELDFESLNVIPGFFDNPPDHDIFSACAEMQREGRVSINGDLKLVMFNAADAGDFPFRLRVQITVSLITPVIYDPIGFTRTINPTPLENAQRRLLQFTYPDATLMPNSDIVTNIPFFYSILGSAPHLHPAADCAMQPDALVPTLLPFQRRSVAWLLEREGKIVTPDGQIIQKPAGATEFSFWERIEEGERVFYLNRLTGNVASAIPNEPPALGAILAEEPGLGKTLEIIALILLNPASPDRHPGVTRWDPEAEVEVKTVKTTLIVTPSALATQWIDELKLHAPSLKVLVYDGWTKVPVPITASDIENERVKRLHRGKGKGKARAKANSRGKPKPTKKKGKAKKKYSDSDDKSENESLDDDEAGEDVGEILDWCSYVQGFDVVITTYQTLKTDVNVARAAPKRPRREDVVYSNVERPRSPLILVEWNRVVMDEVQMAGGGHVEDMVSMIPRLASFAVSGTPARTQIEDLKHVLKFLRIEHIIGSPRHWTRLGLSGYSQYFSAFFQSIAIRTTKASVKSELTIPQQTRFLVRIAMGPVERAVYDQNLESILLELGLDARGVDVRGENKEPDGTLLRTLLRKLRAICTHPQVGQLGNKLFKPGVLKSMEQVLQIQGLVRMAQLQQHGQDKNRYQHCLETLLLAEKETTKLVEEIESTIATHEANRSFLLKQEQETEQEPRNTSTPNDKGKGKERERSLSPLSDLESDDDADDTSDNSAAKAHRAKRNGLKHRLRESQLVMHRVKFLQGDVYHMLGETQSEAEAAAYGAAETIRRSLLKTTEKAANDAMEILACDTTSKGLTKEALQIETPFLEYDFKNAASTKDTSKDTSAWELQEEVNEIIEIVLNEQSSLLWEWRTRMTELLTQKLTPGDEDADGQEYQRTLDDQGEAETYLINYTSLVADRREALLQERTLLAAHDAREKKLRHTKAAIKASAALDMPGEILDGIELHPEHEVLQKELSAKRKALLEDLQGRAVKSVVVEMANKAARNHKDTDPEKIMLKDASSQPYSCHVGTLIDKLEADLALYRKAFNQRILYFRQLQEISDSVSDAVFENTLAQALQECATEQQELAGKINTNRARQRYLDHLSKNKVNDAEADEDEQACILCKCDFIRGFITHCAHVFCEDCMKAWVSKKEGKTCPVCRVPINPDKLERFVVAGKPAEPPEVAPKSEDGVPRSRREITYNMINPETFHQIQATPSFGDHGNKIQTLVRHLLYLRTVDAGAKSIVFSAWQDSLFIVEQALRENGITCLRIDQNRKGMPAVKKFSSSDDIDVLLLHGERENAGLNITCASRVFLLESVVHHGFEIQAIARIDRMGQTRPTEVFCYYAEDTVEKNILDLAARQGTSLYTKNNSVGSILNMASLAGDGEKKVVDAPAKKVQKGDFIFRHAFPTIGFISTDCVQN
ncbi:SNF2 family N-terminal domain-containing protein [Mycena maculata]|uniref:SNF2 family N-terminal domain-containing protein n=1 Tax=Mycena maculata TaxID=230809 RepID=A0AAD7IPP3_9AGAR|nr:SNF2 family N-terminal domain-containing protein [Mycena maculata]